MERFRRIAGSTSQQHSGLLDNALSVISSVFHFRSARVPEWVHLILFGKRSRSGSPRAGRELPAVTLLFEQAATDVERDDDRVRVTVTSAAEPRSEHILEAGTVTGSG
jgi:hypothetical protein